MKKVFSVLVFTGFLSQASFASEAQHFPCLYQGGPTHVTIERDNSRAVKLQFGVSTPVDLRLFEATRRVSIYKGKNFTFSLDEVVLVGTLDIVAEDGNITRYTCKAL